MIQALTIYSTGHMDRVKRIWYLSHMRAAKVQASLRIRAVSPEPPLLAHTSSESRGTFRQKARSLASLNHWACAVKICHDGMLEDTNSLDGAHMVMSESICSYLFQWALAYVGLWQFLRPCGSSGEGRLDFHHRTISKVVRKMFLSDQASVIWWHRRMAEYFSTW